MSEYALIVSIITLLALLLTATVGGEIRDMGETIAAALAQIG